MNIDKDWIYSTNIYEVNLRQYTPEGSFNAFGQHLGRLHDMGVKTLWFMPITPIAQKEKKGSLGSYYACSDYTSINPEFGTLEDFKALVKKAQGLGMKVIIDWVANHTGWDHVWTRTHPDWFEKDPATGDFKRASGMDDIIELDFTKPAMRKAMIEAMAFWVRECGIDGFRCDLAFWVELDFWQEAIPELNAAKPLFWLAESDPLDHPGYMQVFDAAYSWSWMHGTERFYREGRPLGELVGILDRYLSAPGLQAWFTSNHDENSWNGSEYEKYGDAALALAVHSLTWPGLPLIYSGQELPNRKRLLFFDKDIIDWNGEPQLHGFYKTLLELKARHPALDARSEIFRLYTSSDANVLAYLRKKGADEVMVLLNLSPNHVRFDVLSSWVGGDFTEVFGRYGQDLSLNKRFEMKAWEYRVFAKDAGTV
ncbi:MAG TPA: alpha-amylase family glycosyl hydrolase [Flavisolibacter sp.]|nr:alpha-amylase family glycosyl hydrolase [Flavisolibacter sp.]